MDSVNLPKTSSFRRPLMGGREHGNRSVNSPVEIVGCMGMGMGMGMGTVGGGKGCGGVLGESIFYHGGSG